tara:strand:- start:2816 stop:3178 length:363 start_codon:yes stop_codon:yes gene_type:complete
MNTNSLVGVYNADGGLMGELAYFWGKIRGTAHCSLCDITHSKVSMKREWKKFSENLSVPFELLHINEQDPLLSEFTSGKTPCVVANTASGLEIILTSDDLENCKKSVDRFEKMLIASMEL